MRFRSKTNSRRHENKALVAAYREANPLCELHQFPFVPGGRFGEEINHLFSQHKRHDLLSNIIHLSAEAHWWFHQFPVDGRVMAMFRKMDKGELDDNEIKTAGGSFIAGWLIGKEPVFPEVMDYLLELRRVFQ